MGTRLVLIKAPNKRPIETRDETLHSKIQQGEYDPELEWLVHTAINTFWDNIDKPIIIKKLKTNKPRNMNSKVTP